MRRCQILWASAEAQKPPVLAKTLPCAPQTGRNVLHAFDTRGLACVQRGSNVPISVAPVLHAETRAQVRAIRHQSPRTFGQPARVWPRKRLAEVCHEQGLSETPLSAPTRLDAMVRLGGRWQRAQHGIVSPDPAYARQKTAGTGCYGWPPPPQTWRWASQMTCGGVAQLSPTGRPGATTSPCAWWNRRDQPRTRWVRRWPGMGSTCLQASIGVDAVSRDVPAV